MSRCDYSCARCRAIELGYAGRPLSRAELIEVHGGLVEPTNGHRVHYSDEVVEAALVVDAAEVDYEAAKSAYLAAVSEVRDQQERLRRLRPEERFRRDMELEAAEHAAMAEFAEAGERLRAARRHHRELARAESEANSRALYLANAEEARARRDVRKSATRRGVLARLRSGGDAA